MVPNVSRKGHSFKGAFLYYLHDKRQAGEAQRMTAERVGWTETRNLASEDPETAKRIMIATAMQAEAMKREAGRNAGRKGTAGTVYSYSLAWHPDEAGLIGRSEMVKAADASLKALGASHLQAVMVCHVDEPHPHVHVIVNRIHPDNGTLHTFQNDFRKLDAWALAYRQARGEELKYCPARQRKADAIAARAKGEDVPFVRGTPRHWPAVDFAAAASPDQAATRLRGKAADLAKQGEDMKARHSREWQGLSAGHKAERNAAYDKAKQRGAAVREIVKAEFKPLWRDLFRQQRAERKAFDRAGLLATTITAMRAAHELAADRGKGKGWVRTAFMLAVSRKAREALFAAQQTKAQTALAARQKQAADAYWPQIKAERTRDLEAARRAFLDRRAAIIERQAREKDSTRMEWRALAAERDFITAAAPARRRDPDDKGRHFQTVAEIRAAYAETVGKHQQKERTRGRTRSRTRTRPRGEEPTP